MKKIFTFLFCTAIISSAFSQSGNQYVFNTTPNAYYHNSYNDARYERDREIDKINYINNLQVQRLVNDGTLDIWQKRDALNVLESKRIQKINLVYSQYSEAITNGINEQSNNYALPGKHGVTNEKLW